MPSIIVIIFLALLPIPVIYLFYHRYFIVKPSYLYHLEYLLYGAFLAMVLLLMSPYLDRSMSFKSVAAVGFLSAALVEKLGAFIVIYILIRRPRSIVMVMNMTISAMLLGLGFSTVENIVYALSIHESVIIVRLLSAVPLHVLTCGLIGYYLSLARLSRSSTRKLLLAARAFVIPYLFHGLYDTLLYSGGTYTYWIAPLLVILIAAMEFVLAKSQTLPLLDGLQAHDICLEEWETIQREPQYERWILRSMGTKNREHVSFFRFNLGAVRIVIIVLIVLSSAVSLISHDLVMRVLRFNLRGDEVVMLFALLPILYALNLCAVGVVNPRYFQNSIIKIPIIIDVDMAIDQGIIKTITYHVTGNNCYLKTVDPLPAGLECSLTFTGAGFASQGIPGRVVWDSHDDQKQLSGTLVRFSRRARGFRLFLVKYYLYKLSRGLSFNLRLPGFHSVRQLFVRPISVMQKEWRYSAGTRLFEQGEEGKIFYLVRKGEVDIFKTLDTGEQVLLTTQKEGDIFGEMAMVGNQPRLASAVCRTDCLLAVAEADNLEALIEGNPIFTHRLIKNFANRLHASEQIMLKNISCMEQDMKGREELLMKLVQLLFLTARSGDSGLAVSPGVIKDYSLKLGIDEKLVRQFLGILSDAGDSSSLEKAVRDILDDRGKKDS